MPGLYDDAGGYVDPQTGMWVPAAPTPQPGQANASWNPLRALGNAIVPQLVGPNPPSAFAPPATPQSAPQAPPPAPPQAPAGPAVPPQDQAAQLAAVGINPDAYGQSAPQQPMPTPPVPPQAPPQAAPQPAPQEQPQANSQDPLGGISNNRRNNPLNLRFAKQDGATNDNGFAAFQTPEAGIAAAKNQFAINASRGINTLTGLVSSWAPPNENDTAAYITTVSKATGIDPNAKIDLTDPVIQAKLIPAMSLVENGPIGKGAPGGTQVASGGSGQPSGPSTTTMASTSSPVQPSMNDALLAALQKPMDTSVPFPNVGKPDRRQQLLAVAAGLLQGKSFSQGLGKGLENLVGVNNTSQNQQIQANQQAVERARLLQQQNYQNVLAQATMGKLGLAANKPAGPPVMGVGDDGKPVAMIRLADGSTVPLPGVTPQMINAGTSQQRLQLAQQAQNLKNDPAQLARLTQEKVAAASAQKDQDAVYASQSQDQQGLQDIDQAQQLISQRPDLMGPTLANRWSRFSADIGLSGQASDLNALQKMTADQRNTFLSTLTNGHVGGIRSNAELKNLSQAVADVGTSPAAANYILNLQKSQLLAKDAWRQELTARSQTDPDSIAGRQYNVTKNQFFDDYWKQHPLPDYTSPSGTSSPAPSAAPGAPSGTPPGVSKVLRYDSKGNLVQ